MITVTGAAYAAIAVLALFVVVHLALILGAPCGVVAWGGSHRRLPVGYRIASGLAVVVAAVFAGVAGENAGITHLFGVPVLGVLNWLVFGFLALVIVPIVLSPSIPERFFGGIISTVVAALFLVMALG